MQQHIIKLRHRTPAQKRISESTFRFNVASWGRQSGKTTFGLDKMIWAPMRSRPGSIYWYVLQTHAAAEVAFNRFMNNVIGTPLFKEKNESEKWVALPDGRMVFFKSGENYQDLRVETLDGAIVDEYRQQHPDLWPQVIRPMLARRKGWADFLSTPNGFDHFYDLAKYAMNNETNEWGFFKAPSTDAWWWSTEEIASAKASMSELEFAQEIMAEFVNLTAHRVYHSFTDVN